MKKEMPLKNWEHFFKPEVRNSGQLFVRKGKVTLRSPSDTEIDSYVQGSASFKVTLKCTSVESTTFIAACSCPQSSRGQFCKHVWATLVVALEKNSDFFESKTDLLVETSKTTSSGPTKRLNQPNPETKAKQAEYRKQQYQKQKQKLKELKKSKHTNTVAEIHPPEVETALEFFFENGFPLKESLTQAAVGTAMKKLARVFHPDMGGSHEEILQLNEHAEVLTKFAKF